MFPLAILEKVQVMWEIPLDGIPHPSQIQQLMREGQRIGKQGDDPRYPPPESDEPGVMPVATAIELIERAWQSVPSYVRSRYEPESYVGEAQTLRAWVNETVPYIAQPAVAQSMVATWEETIIQEGGIQCHVEARWALERDTPGARIRLAYNAALCAPVLSVQRSLLLFRHMTLCLTKGQKGASQRLDVDMGWGGEQREHDPVSQ